MSYRDYSYPVTHSSVLSSLSSLRSRPYSSAIGTSLAGGLSGGLSGGLTSDLAGGLGSAVTTRYSATPDVNEVYPGLFVGDAVAAKDKAFLRRMGIKYVLNTAEGRRYTQVDTDHAYYRDCPGLHYKGFQLMDLPSTDIAKYFNIAANFIDEGISRGNRVLVHCMMGVSRSATCAVAFLMIKRGMSLVEALALVRSRRDIHPNDGFVRQLQELDRELRPTRLR